jgi:type IV secretion system protein VirB4
MADYLARSVRERDAGPVIPYLRHVDETVIALASGGLMTMIALDGMSFETADAEDLDDLHAHLNQLYCNIADERLSLWVHLIRGQETSFPDPSTLQGFSARLSQRYRRHMAAQALYRNDLYITLVWQEPESKEQKVRGLVQSLFGSPSGVQALPDGALEALIQLRAQCLSGLARLRPSALGLYEHAGLLFSRPCEILHHIISGRSRPVPLVDGRLSGAIYQDRIVYGRELAEIRHVGHSRYAGMLSLRDYPARTRPGMLNALLTAPHDLILTQSFSFLSKGQARSVMTRKQNQMLSANDPATSQLDGLGQAIDALESNHFVLGEHHLSLCLFADTPDEASDALAKAQGHLASHGAIVVREDLGLEANWWAQLPGNLRFRCRSGAITSRNFASLSPMHSYPVGQASGNHWGAAVAVLKTASRAPYFFSFHEGDLGNTFICGPSGAGKTVLVNFLLSQLQAHQPQIAFFDKDRGSDLFIRASGGTYLALQNGRPTGCAPLKALTLTPENQQFLAQWVATLCGLGQDASPIQKATIAHAVAALSDIPQGDRTIGVLRSFLNNADPDGTGMRLRRFEAGGPLGWVFDNEEDLLDLNAPLIGYDMTQFLDNAEIRAPLMSYLFHRIEERIDGRRIVIVVDEFWKALADERFRELAQDKLKTIRKQNGFMVFATQSPRDALASPISHSIIEQCPTQIFLPNPRANEADYVEGLRLTQREFALISRELTSHSRRFLIKQGQRSVVAELDLQGFDDELQILSGRVSSVEAADRLRALHGDDPDIWLPLLFNHGDAP